MNSKGNMTAVQEFIIDMKGLGIQVPKDKAILLMLLFDKAKAMEKEQLISFVEWYSGMEREKVERAYQRYLKEKFKSQ